MMSRLYKSAGLVAIATLATTFGVQNQASAALTNGTGSVLDSTTGLEWLKLSATDGLSPTNATTANPGYSVANGTQVQGLLGSFFAQFGIPGDPLTPPADPTAAISPTQFSAWTNLFGTTFENTLPLGLGTIVNSGGRFNAAPGVIARFGMLQDPINAGGFGAGQFAIFAGDTAPADRVGVFMVRQQSAVTSVPTPALLPGLIGLGFSVFKRKKNQTVEA